MIKADRFSPEWKKILFRIQGIILKKWAIKKSIAHWERMISWMENKYNSGSTTTILTSVLMLDEIGETWYGEFCALCQTFLCRDCPLKKAREACIESPNTLWVRVANAPNIKMWIANAKELLAVLKSLLKNLQKWKGALLKKKIAIKKLLIKRKEKVAIQKSIDHWKRMIFWMGTQKEWRNSQKIGVEMMNKIGENWFGKSCPLCSLFSCKCRKCPLDYATVGRVGCGIGSPWFRVYFSVNKKEWLKNAEEMLELLKSLLRKDNLKKG
jgi:hypothetical protein